MRLLAVIIIIIIIMILAFVVFNPGDLYYLGYQKNNNNKQICVAP